MHFKGWNMKLILDALREINPKYDDNLKFVETRSGTTKSIPWVRGVLRVVNSHGTGHRTARATGRHGPWASWAAHRDFMLACFKRCPGGVLQTGFIEYRGVADFLLRFRETEVYLPGERVRRTGCCRGASRASGEQPRAVRHSVRRRYAMRVEIVMFVRRDKYWALIRQVFMCWLTNKPHMEQKVIVHEGQIERMVNKAIRNHEESVTQRLN